MLGRCGCGVEEGGTLRCRVQRTCLRWEGTGQRRQRGRARLARCGSARGRRRAELRRGQHGVGALAVVEARRRRGLGCQLPLDESRVLVRCALLAKGGPEGGTTRKALRAWRSLSAEAARYGLESFGLPATKGLVAHVVHSELDRAQAAKSGSQGGATVGSSFRDGFLLLEDVGFPIDAHNFLVEAAARPSGPRVARPRSHAGSFPLGVYCQVEHVANGPPSAMRTIARSFVMTAATHCIRLNDSLNCVVRIGIGRRGGRQVLYHPVLPTIHVRHRGESAEMLERHRLSAGEAKFRSDGTRYLGYHVNSGRCALIDFGLHNTFKYIGILAKYHDDVYRYGTSTRKERRPRRCIASPCIVVVYRECILRYSMYCQLGASLYRRRHIYVLDLV